MDPVGPPIASSVVAGAAQAERAQAKEASRAEQRPAARFRRLLDDAELTVTQAESTDAVRDLKGNDQEESHEERQERRQYDAQGQAHPPGDRPAGLDVEV